MRIFDCKNETCKKITRKLPSVIDSLCPDCTDHFLEVKQGLNSLNISYVLNRHLVRGLDYYTKTCFEITHPDLGAQNALGAGGRYDELVKELGGPDKPAIGFALGLERVIAALGPESIKTATVNAPCVYIATIGDEARRSAFKILDNLREQGICSDTDYLDKSLKGQMRQADKLGFKYVAILGEEELKKQTLILRDMQDKSQKEVRVDDLAKEIK